MADLQPASRYPWRCSAPFPLVQNRFARRISTRLQTGTLLLTILLSFSCLGVTGCPLQSQEFPSPPFLARHRVYTPNTDPKFAPFAFLMSSVSLPRSLSNLAVRKLPHPSEQGPAPTGVDGNQKTDAPRVDHTGGQQQRSSLNYHINDVRAEAVSGESNMSTAEVSNVGQTIDGNSAVNKSRDTESSSDLDLEGEDGDVAASTSSTLLAELRGNAKGRRLTSGGLIELIEWLFVFFLVAPGTFPAIGCVLYACTSFARRRFFASFLENASTSDHVPSPANSATIIHTTYPRPSRVPLQRLSSNLNSVSSKPAPRTTPVAADPANAFTSTPTNFASRSRSRSPMVENSDAV